MDSPDAADDNNSVDSHNVSDIADGLDEEVVESGAHEEEEEEEEGEDLMANMEEDYRSMSHLDAYEAEGLDEAVGQSVDYEQAQAARLRAEREMERRDARENRGAGKRLPGALEDVLEEAERRPTRRRRLERAQAGFVDGDEDDMPDIEVDLDNQKGELGHYLAQEPVQKAVGAHFTRFLRTFKDGIYMAQLRDRVSNNKQSLEVHYVDLSEALPSPAIWLVDRPRQMLDILHRAAADVARQEFPNLFEDAGGRGQDVFVRITDLPIHDSLRDIRMVHLNKLIRTSGVVTRRTGVFPQLEVVKYDCKCGYILGPFYQNTEQEIKPLSCPVCQSKTGIEVNSSQTIYRNFQKLTLQETPGTVAAGRLPRHKEIILLHDLIDCARPGEEIEVVGVYSNTYDASLNAKNGFPVFSTVIEANHVSTALNKFAAYKLTEEDQAALSALGRQPDVGERIVRSIAPSIYGHEDIKLGLALSLFGGQEKHAEGTHRLRGDINVLLLGDPGTAKSQFLKYTQGIAQRAVYTTGKGASAVGLTAAVQKDAVTKEWTLEGGALVLADRGTCLIDEFDKMNDQDRVSIHEAMEQQSISISKAGIVTSLQARCSVVAAANPMYGRYDRSRTFAENVELSDPILSRFDVLCVIEDVVDPVNDERLADFVVGSHTRAHPEADPEEDGGEGDPATAADVIPQDVLKKYITFAKTKHPKLTSANHGKIIKVYTELRRESQMNHGMPIAVRHLESMIRMAEAHARMHLRDQVTGQDVDKAVSVMLESFIGTQKLSVQKVLKKKFRHYLVHAWGVVDLLLNELQRITREKLRELSTSALPPLDGLLRVPGRDLNLEYLCRLLRKKAAEYRINELAPLFSSPKFSSAGFTYLADEDVVTFPA